MPLNQYCVNRDHFEADEGPGLAFPCCVCKHRHCRDRDEPCRTCDHNANADPAPSHLDRLLDRGKLVDWS